VRAYYVADACLDNNLIGGLKLPDEICQLSQLRSFEATSNKLVGCVPARYRPNARLQLLVTVKQRQRLTLPEFCSTLVELQGILLDDNEFTGNNKPLQTTFPSSSGCIWKAISLQVS
jgi:hypothetical protein